MDGCMGATKREKRSDESESKSGSESVGGVADTPECWTDSQCADHGSVCTRRGRCREKGPESARILSPCDHDTDCRKRLLCMLGVCDTPGRKRNYCTQDEHCRSDYYCQRRKRRCWPKMRRGRRCKSHAECKESVCLPEQDIYAVRIRNRKRSEAHS